MPAVALPYPRSCREPWVRYHRKVLASDIDSQHTQPQHAIAQCCSGQAAHLPKYSAEAEAASHDPPEQAPSSDDPHPVEVMPCAAAKVPPLS